MLSIRAAQAADIPTIRSLAFTIWPTAYGAILSAGQISYMLQLIYSEEALRSQFLDGQQFLLAFDGERAVGFAAFGPFSADTFKLHKLYVLPALQGQGAGRRLLEVVISHAGTQGAARLILNVNRENPALSFYEKMGFCISEAVDLPIGEGYYMNDYVMAMSL